ncbi:MAG: tetratricopeptide repeat-containing sensor histidine kinase [Acidobacteria bacterium]|nr:tetratricopeptide repeat-containing sensor histidine kinase [Acidobacteriota bacterium]MBU4306676.1 tetratricopeptide repeat-containing sensor histidine kinase [Acidobacteriota bacterium]MCG2812735.1 tetratricopeptide repeat-containing sensor histidine kinase [Candidatus Aminicenantes bacterium]
MKKYIFTVIIFILSINVLAQNNIDSLEIKLKTVSGKERVDILNQLSTRYYTLSPEKVIKYGQQALELSQKYNYSKGRAYALKNIGAGNYYLSNYDKTLEYYLNSLKIMEEIGDIEGVSNILNNIGVVYWKLNNYDKALEIYTESLKIMKELENREGIVRSLNNIGLIYLTLKNYEKALEILLETLKITKEIGDTNNIAYCLNNIGNNYWYLGNYDKSLEYYMESLKINEEINNKYGIAVSIKNIGGIYLKLKNYDKSLTYLKKGLKLAKEIEAKDLLQNIYEAFYEFYNVKENYKKSLEYYRLYSEVKDSIFTEESSKKIVEMQTKYETEKKEKENEVLRKNNEIQNSEIIRQTNIRNSFIVISLLILILVFVIYQRYRGKKRANKMLSNKNQQINDQKNQLSKTLAELRETQKTLVEVAHKAGMAEIATGILHNVGNVLNSVKVSSQFLKERVEDSKVKGLKKAVNLIKEHEHDLGSYITSDERGKMLPKYLIKLVETLKEEQDIYLEELINLNTGISHVEEIVAVQQDYAGVSGVTEKILLTKMMDDVVKMYRDSFRTNKIEVYNNYSKVSPVLIEKGKLMQVFVNILKNAKESLIMKSEGDKVITINISEDKESQNVEIIDNGVGINEEDLESIFLYGFSTKEHSKGFGLHTSALTVAEFNGKIFANSDGKDKGSKFTIIIPKN